MQERVRGAVSHLRRLLTLLVAIQSPVPFINVRHNSLFATVLLSARPLSASGPE